MCPRAVKAATLALLAGACASNPSADRPMLVAVDLGLRNYCSVGVSPRIALRDVPAGTTAYRIRIENADVLFPDAWESTVPAAGAVIAEGALPDYRGICPRMATAFSYRFVVTAETADGRALARGETLRRVAAWPRTPQFGGGLMAPAPDPAAVRQPAAADPLPFEPPALAPDTYLR